MPSTPLVDHELLDQIATHPSPSEWTKTLRHWLLVLGVALLVSGIIYFGAYNWNQLNRFEKLGLMEVLFIGFSLAVLSRGLHSKEGSVLLIASACMVGALLAVLGQVYQSGADSYLLFLAWAFLIVPWCAVGRSNALWTLEFILLNTAFCLYWDQVLRGNNLLNFAPLFLILNLTLAGAWTVAKSRFSWMRPYPADLALAASLVPVVVVSCAAIVSLQADDWSLPLLALTLLALLVFRGQHFVSMVILATSLLCLGTSLAVNFFLDSEIIGILLIGLSIMAQLGLVVKWLMGVHRRNLSAATSPIIGVEEQRHSLGEPLQGSSVQSDSQTSAPPWYFQLMVGTAAWIASLFVLVFFLLWIYQSEILLTLCGAIIYGVTTHFRRAGPPSHFFRHALLSTHLAGIMVTVAGLALAVRSWDSVPGFMAALLLALSAKLYPDSLGRFLFGLGVVLCGLWATNAALGELAGACWLIFVAALLSWTCLHLERLLQGPSPALYLPLIRGVSCGLMASTSVYNFSLYQSYPRSALTLGILVVAIIVSRKLAHPPQVWAGFVLLGLLTQSVPSLLASILVYTLGFSIRQAVVQGIALGFLAASGSFYYYSLELTLMAKSITLVLSGVLLLVLRRALRETPEEGETHDSSL